MMLRSLRSSLALLIALGLPAAVSARTFVVKDGESIREAVDQASPGDTIRVKRGTYTAPPGEEYVVEVVTSDLTLIGDPGAVIEASGVEYGIMVGEDSNITPAGCPPITVDGFRIQGFTVQNATDTGVRLVGVRNYQLLDGRYLDNVDYGPFPICSEDGVIRGNFVSGHDDAAIYVGDDDGVLVEGNFITDSTIGIEIENSENAVVRGNVLVRNTGGVLVIAAPGLPKPFTQDVEIVGNVIVDNNRDNPFPPGPRAISLFPRGTGILNIGGDDVRIHRNFIVDNGSFGVATIGNFFVFEDPRLEPFVDGQVVRHNAILKNGGDPDPLRLLTPPADIIFVPDLIDPTTGMVVLPDPDPSDNCYADNLFETDFPPGVVDLFPCD
ncbi:MAG: right-handed parallel beta-helix repeat-containing protein [Myxococcota bacterium]